MTIAPQPLRSGDPGALGGYVLLGRLGEGGMGVVYLARDRLGRPVAVKSIRAQHAGDPRFLGRFRREVEAARKVPRFCTAAVLDADLDADEPYLVTEFVDGPSLHAAVGRDGPLRGGDLDALAVGVAAALTAIHDAGLVHRDLKPGNVLLSRAGPRVIDFGIARAVDATTQTLTGQVLGTPGYMAPEQVSGARVTPAADVFAWGGVVAFAASGAPPFGRVSSVPAALHRILHEDPDLGALEERLRGIAAAALDKEPARRPAAAALLETLKTYADRAEAPRTRATEVLEKATEPAAPPPVPVPLAPPAPPAGAPVAEAGTGGAREGTAAPGAVRPGEPPATAPGMAGETSPGGTAGSRGRLARRLLAATAAAALAVAVGWAVLVDPFGLRDPGGQAAPDGRAGGQPSQTTGGGAEPGAEPAVVPDYLGWHVDDALARMEGADLAVRTESRPSSADSLDHVLEMDPPPGSAVAPGAPVTLYVGDGTQGGGAATQARDWLVFKRLDGTNRTVNEAPIVVVDPDGNQTRIAAGDSPDIAPDGSRVAYVAPGEDLAGQVMTARPDGGDVRPLTDVEGRSVRNLAWSPDGGAVAFFVNTGGLYVVDADGGGQRQVADVDGFGLAWSPDGTRIVFRRPVGDDQQLWVVNTDGSGLRAVTGADLPGHAVPVQPSWSPDGDTILFGGSEGGIYVVDRDGTGFRQVAEAGTFQPSWTPDGDIAFVRAGSGARFFDATGPVSVMAPDGTGERPLDGVIATGPVQWGREG